MKAIASIVILLAAALHTGDCFLCYSKDAGSDSRTVVFCPSTSCFSVGGVILGVDSLKKGCADKEYPNICQSNDLVVLSEQMCFCNSFLCNASSMPSIFLPLLLLPYFLQKLL